MPLTQTEQQIVNYVVQCFLRDSEAAPHKKLIRDFKNPQAIEHLIRCIMLQQIGYQDGYLPRLLAFVYCNDPADIAGKAKVSGISAIRILKSLFENVEKDSYTMDDVVHRAEAMFVLPPTIDDLHLGLYLARELPNVVKGTNVSQKQQVVSLQLHDNIVTLDNPEHVWNEYVGHQRKYLEGGLDSLENSVVTELVDEGDFATLDPLQAFLPAGSSHDAYRQIRNIVQTATSEIFIVDSYVDESLWTLLTNVPATVKIRVMTMQRKADFALEAKQFAKQHRNTIEIRETRDYHDRFIVTDGDRVWHLGASIKDAGNKAFAFSELVRPAVRSSAIADMESTWDGATLVPL